MALTAASLFNFGEDLVSMTYISVNMSNRKSWQVSAGVTKRSLSPRCIIFQSASLIVEWLLTKKGNLVVYLQVYLIAGNVFVQRMFSTPNLRFMVRSPHTDISLQWWCFKTRMLLSCITVKDPLVGVNNASIIVYLCTF